MLAYATTYYVGINTGVITGAALGGKAFNGIGKAGAWSIHHHGCAGRVADHPGRQR